MMYHYAQLLAGQLSLGHILSDLGWFLEPVLMGRTAFMPNQRFVVVTKAGCYSSLAELISSALYLKGEGTVAQPHSSPTLYLLFPFWLYPAPLLRVCVCVCIVCCVTGVKNDVKS